MISYIFILYFAAILTKIDAHPQDKRGVSICNKDTTCGDQKRNVLYSPEDWEIYDESAADDFVRPKLMVPAANEPRVLNSCGRWGGYLIGPNWKGVNWECYQDKETLDSKNPSGIGPCKQFPAHVKGNRRIGIWPGNELNCVLFLDEQCRYTKLDKDEKTIINLPAVTLRPPGFAMFEKSKWWKDKSGFKPFKDGNGVPGPKAYQCFLAGKAEGLVT